MVSYGPCFRYGGHSDLDFGDIALVNDYDTPLGHEQFCILSISNMAERSYGHGMDFGMCAQWPWTKRYDLG